jgi:hypothetical protein
MTEIGVFSQSICKVLTTKEARKYLKRDISDERLQEILGYLYGLTETIIRQERQIYEQDIRKTTKSK